MGLYTDSIAAASAPPASWAALAQGKRRGRASLPDLASPKPGLQFLIPPLLDYAANGGCSTETETATRPPLPTGLIAAGEDRWWPSVFTEEEWMALAASWAIPPGRVSQFATCTDEIVNLGARSCYVNHTAEEVMRLSRAGISAGILGKGRNLTAIRICTRQPLLTLRHRRSATPPTMGWFPSCHRRRRSWTSGLRLGQDNLQGVHPDPGSF